MGTLHQLSRHVILRLAWCVEAAMLSPLASPANAAAEPTLQIITTVVNLSVPAGAFDPGTGKAEVTLPRGLVLQVKSDGGWKLRMRASRANFVTQSLPLASKPVSDLQLRDAAGGQLMVPSVAYLEIAKGGNTHEWVEFAFDVIFQATSADAGGLYSVNLEFDFY